MNLDALIVLVTVALALSVATDRGVALFKNLPWFGADRGETGGWRWFRVQFVALGFGLFFAYFLSAVPDGAPAGQGRVLQLTDTLSVPWWILGALASGGSTFWKDLLGILNDVKHVQSTVRKTREQLQAHRSMGTKQKNFGGQLVRAGQPTLGANAAAFLGRI